MKKIIAILLAAASILTVFCACNKTPENETTTAVSTTAAPSYSDEFDYSVLENGTIKINSYKGNGIGDDGKYFNVYTIPAVIDGKNVTVIASGAFKNAFRDDSDPNHCVAVTFPRTLVEIEERAFEGSAISKAYIDSAADFKKIGAYAFAECDKLVQVTIPYKTEEIGEKAFYLCTSLIFATIRSNDVKIADDAFDIGVSKERLCINCNEKADKIVAYAKKHGFSQKFLLKTSDAQ